MATLTPISRKPLSLVLPIVGLVGLLVGLLVGTSNGAGGPGAFHLRVYMVPVSHETAVKKTLLLRGFLRLSAAFSRGPNGADARSSRPAAGSP